MTAAKSTDWTLLPFPDEVKELSFQREFPERQMRNIKLGFLPKQMEDKWFVYYENDTLNFHRSWSGIHIYQISFAVSGGQGKVIKALVNRNAGQYKEQDDKFDALLLSFLIDRFLLGKNTPYPSR